MADQPTLTPQKPRAASSVRGFLNYAAALPDYGVLPQKDIAPFSKEGGAGLVYGEGNAVPIIAMAAAQQSGTAYRCLERRSQMLEGTGFPVPIKDPAAPGYDAAKLNTMGDTPVPGHPGKTANDLWAEICSYGGFLNGDAALVRYNAGGRVGEIHNLPFGSVRKTRNGAYLLNHKFGRKGFSRGDTTEHLPFDDDPKTVRAVLKRAREIDPKTKKPYGQPGQILYIYGPKAGEEDYPLPPHWAGLEAVLTDTSYANYDLSEVRTGFNAKGILVMIGKADDSVKDENGKTEKDRQDELLRSYTQQGAIEQGVLRESIMVLDADTKEEAPLWIATATTVDLRWLSEKKEAVAQEVCRHIGIPPVLVGFAKAGQLSATQEIINAVQLTQDSLEPLRKVLLRGFVRLMPELAGLVPGQRKPLAFVDPAIMAHLTPEEIRALGGYGPTPAAP